MGMVQEFREFAIKGNMIDLAVGVIIGGAFGKIIDSLVGDIIMPVISALFGGKIDFTNMFVTLGQVPSGTPMTYDALKKAGVPLFAYGSFITILINFLLLALVIFVLIKQVNKWKEKPAAAAPPPPSPSEIYLKEIRDAMVKR